MNNNVIKFINSKGYNLPTTDIYNIIDVWKSWYLNDIEWHSYKDQYGTQRKMNTLGMAKKVCEDWASIGFTEKDIITTSVKGNNKYVEQMVKETNLINDLPEMIEMASWSGTCAVIHRLKNVTIKNGIMIANEDTKDELIKISADKIIPLKIEDGKIIDVAFVSNTTIGDVKAIYIEMHQLKKEGYQISNIFIDAKNGKQLENKEVIKTFNTGSKMPLFAILEPPTINPIEDNLGLGLSIYGNAIDQLKACDITYHNFVMDYKLGGKKVFYNKKLVQYRTINVINSDGTTTTREVPIYPDDITKQQFLCVGDETNINDNDLMQEYNPSLRIDEDKAGLQFAMDLLSFKCNLGTKYYSLEGSNVVTATQYVGDRQDLIQNAKKYRNNITEFVQDIVKAGLLLARVMLKENVNEDCEVVIENRDGILVTDEELKEQYINEIANGLRSKASYLMKFYGMTKEQALEELALIDEEENAKIKQEEPIEE